MIEGVAKYFENIDPVHYDHTTIEPHWQEFWQRTKIYEADLSSNKEKFYCLVEFPYPSGAGLHVGHVRSYASMDAFVRYKRMKGFNVLYPMGWDAFGLPAENYAIKVGIHPSKTVAENITHFKAQCQSLGLSFDWSREINTTDPNYYRQTQWLFLQLLKAGLAYRNEVSVNWCPTCRTNLADEEVLADGMHERCGNPTEKRSQIQWLLRITNYAQRLLDDLKLVDYSEKIRIQQENWIGRKEGAVIKFQIPDYKFQIEAFTTRPDTMFGATFIVLAPEHSIVNKILSGEIKVEEKTSQAIKAYLAQSRLKTEIERKNEKQTKTGVSTGLFVINSLNNKLLPVWISDFVLSHFGTGAVVGVPGHDARDLAFAKQFNLPVEVVVLPDPAAKYKIDDYQMQFLIGGKWVKGPYEGAGVGVNSGFIDGLPTELAKIKVIEYLEAKGFGKRTVTFHLRDWVFSRQHYWGEPIPVVHCAKCGVVPVPEKDLPVELPYVEKYEPSGTGESPLANMSDWVNTRCPACGGPGKRETDTMPNWAGSNWYYLAYLLADKLGNPKSEIRSTKQIQNSQSDYSKIVSDFDIRDSNFKDIFTVSKNILDHWMPVDIYEGGFEHTTLHLLYSRFIYKFMFDLGLVPGPEPYAKRRSHGIVLGPDGRKMSKSFGNVINPDEIVKQYGSDTLRLYEMFMGPFEQSVSWSDSSLQGCYRFLTRVNRLTLRNVSNEDTPTSLKTSLQAAIKKVGEDIGALKFNTAVAILMEFINDWENSKLSTKDAETFLRLLAPFAPHLSEELWHKLLISADRESDSHGSVHLLSWPEYDPELLKQNRIVIVAQVNGKLRDSFEIEAVADERAVTELALSLPKVRKYISGEPSKIIYIPGKLINFVIKV